MEIEGAENIYRDVEEQQLMDEIEVEMRKIHLAVEKLYNNIYAVSDNPIEKCLIQNQSFSSKLFEVNPEDCEMRQDSLKAFEESLQQELSFLQKDIETTLVNMHERNEICARLDEHISDLNTMKEAYEMYKTSDQQVASIMRNIKIRFRKEKADLQKIVSYLSSENSDIQDLIARIVDYHFSEGSDKYLQLEASDEILEQVEFLRRTTLFEVNPLDPLQIRLVDLL